LKKLCILGVNGFIGHHLSNRILAETDWEVYGMDMGSERIADLMRNPRFHFFEGDITINKEWIEYHIRKCDVILPLVAIATPATTAPTTITPAAVQNHHVFHSGLRSAARGIGASLGASSSAS